MRRGQIVTFYSYKGGVGRSFALANVSVALATWGYRVLCIDWDLEAPGLGHYFGVERSNAGLVDLVSGQIESGATDQWRRYVQALMLEGGAQVDFIASGTGDAGYIARLQRLRWDELYERHGLAQVLEAWREAWRAEYDFVLIDSRTGITDTSAICTAHLPDVLVVLFTANRQSLEGCVDVIDRANAARRRLPFDRSALHVLPVPARFDSKEEYRRAIEWQAKFVEHMGHFLDSWAEPGVAQADIISRVTIPYVAYWSFGEGLPVLEEQSLSPGTVRFALETIAALLGQRLANTGFLLKGAEGYIQVAARAAHNGEGYDVDVVLGMTEDMTSLGRGLIDALAARDLRAIEMTRSEGALPAGETAAVPSARHAVFLIGRGVSPAIDGEMRRLAKQMLDGPEERAVIPVLLVRSVKRSLPTLLQRLAVEVDADIGVESLADRIVAELRPIPARAHEMAAPSIASPPPRERPEVRQALQRLESKNPRMRQIAFATLVRLGSIEHLPAMIGRLSDDDVRVRDSARTGLLDLVASKRQADPEFRLDENVLPLPPEPLAQVGAGELLALAGEERGVDLLLNLVDHAEAKVRVRVASALGALVRPGVADWLSALIEDPDQGVVAATLVGLVRLSGQITQEVLASSKRIPRYSFSWLGIGPAIARVFVNPQPEFLNSLNGLFGQALVDDIIKAMLAGPASAIVRNWIVDRIAFGETDEVLRATELLSQFSQYLEPRIVETLITRLRDEYGEGRLALVLALGLTRSKAAVPALSEALADSAPQIRSAGIEALSKLRSRDVVGMLEPMLEDSAASVRVAAIRGLAGLDSTLGASVGRRLMKDDSFNVRLAAVQAVGNRPLLEDAEPIAALLGDSEDSVRLAAIRVLSQIGTPWSIPILRNALDDARSDIRMAALQGYARAAKFDAIAQRLLTNHVDGQLPWLDVREPIEQDWIVKAAELINLTPSAVRTRLEKMNAVLGNVLALPSAPDEAASDTAS